MTTGEVTWVLRRPGADRVDRVRRAGGRARRPAGQSATERAGRGPGSHPAADDGDCRQSHCRTGRTGRAVVRLDGKHGDWLPFSVRLYFYAGATDVRVVHSFIWDGDPDRDFLAGLGLSADVVMRDELGEEGASVQLGGFWGFSAHAIGPQAEPAASYLLTVGQKSACKRAPIKRPPCRSRPVTRRLARTACCGVSTVDPSTWTIEETGSTRWRAPSPTAPARSSATSAWSASGRTPRTRPAPHPAADDGDRRRSVTVEQDGPVRAVVRLDGKHGDWLPFTVRLYFYAGADRRTGRAQLRLGRRSGPGLPGRAGPQRRRGRCATNRTTGTSGWPVQSGFLTEAVRGLTGLRRDPGERYGARRWPAVRSRRSPTPRCPSRLHLIPQWNDYTLDQTSADGFTLRKRTGPGHAWVTIPPGTRSPGYGYVGGASGGLGFGLRDFWKLHPTRLDIRNAATDLATATVWMWSPSAPAMDVRYWHDGMDQDTLRRTARRTRDHLRGLRTGLRQRSRHRAYP